MPTNDKHPAPWKWDSLAADGELSALYDANGEEIIRGSDLPGAFYVDSEYAREQLRSASEMANLLAKLEFSGGAVYGDGYTCCAVCGTRHIGGTKRTHKPGCKLIALVARLDTARAKGV